MDGGTPDRAAFDAPQAKGGGVVNVSLRALSLTRTSLSQMLTATADRILLAGNTIRRTPYAGIRDGGPTPIGTKLAGLARLELRDNPVTEAGGLPVDISADQREHIDHLQI